MRRSIFPAILLAAGAAYGAAPEQSQLDASETLFTVMAAVNAAGYDTGLTSPNSHPLRAAVRAELARRNIPVLDEIRRFLKERQEREGDMGFARYTSFALALGEPPKFAFRERDYGVPPDALPLRGFIPLLTKFYEQAGIHELWQGAQPAIDQYIDRYHERVSRAVLEVNAYLRAESSIRYLGRRFQIYIDLLGEPNQVQTRNYGPDYFVVVTPSPEPRIEDIRHAYLFYMLDPLALREAEVLKRKSGLGDHAQRATALPEVYKSDFVLLASASLVKAVESRLDRKPGMANEALLQGYLLAPYFAEQLARYEKQEQAMRFFYPEMVRALDVIKEDARLSAVEFSNQAPARPVKQAAAPPPPPPELTGAERTLEQGEQYLRARDASKARQAFLDALKQAGERPLEARAYYGLARVAALERDPELAERLFQKTLESGPDAQVKAWTHVYLGRLADAAGERDEAVRHYKDALTVESAPPGARQAAEQGIQQTFKR